MHRADLELELAQVEAFLASGERAVLRQKETIARLDGGGHAAPQARQALVGMEQLQLLYEGERHRLHEELAKLS